MQGMFSGIENARYLDRGQWFDPGFDGDVRITKTSAVTGRESGLMFVIEFEVLTSNAHPKHPVGGKFVRMVKLTQNRETGLGECRGIAGFAMGVDPNSPQYLQPLQQLLEQCVLPQNEMANPLIGRALHLMTTLKAKKRSQGNFTLHAWGAPTGQAGPAYNPAAHAAPANAQSQWGPAPQPQAQPAPQWGAQMPQAQPFPQQSPWQGQPAPAPQPGQQWGPAPQAPPNGGGWQGQPAPQQGPPNMPGEPFRWPGT